MRIRTVLILGIVALFVAVLILPALTSAQGAKEEAAAGPKYVGVMACKPCHQGAAKGNVYEIWKASKHATAFTALGEANQKNEVCLGCHTTGVGKAMAPGKTAADLEGVQCEACHGPGSEYKAMTVMKNKEEAMKKGLVIPNEKTCVGCHAGTFPKGHVEVPKFDYASMLVKIEHHMTPVKEGK